MEKRICEICGKTLHKIGEERKNGKLWTKDWKSRKYHKTCYLENKHFINWKIQQEFIKLKELEEEFENLINN